MGKETNSERIPMRCQTEEACMRVAAAAAAVQERSGQRQYE